MMWHSLQNNIQNFFLLEFPLVVYYKPYTNAFVITFLCEMTNITTVPRLRESIYCLRETQLLVVTPLSTLLYKLGSVFPLSHRFSGLGFLSQLIRLWAMPHYRFALNEESYFADTELAGFQERILSSRSKSNPYGIGSRSVMLKQQDTRLPTAEPRPGPTAMPLDFAQLIKSCTIRR